MEDNDLASVSDIYPGFMMTKEMIYTGVSRDKLVKQTGASDTNASKQVNLRKLNKVDKDTNLSEQTLIGISVKNDHEDDKNDANEASTAPLDVSQVTLTGSTVNISEVTGTMPGICHHVTLRCICDATPRSMKCST